MAVNFKYWDDCMDIDDMEAMWVDPEVSKEWIDVGETKGQKVHLSRDPDGQLFLTQTEMKAVAGIIVHRHFKLQIDPDMICAIAEIESDRQPTAQCYNKKTKEITVGLMQMIPTKAEWLVREMGYRAYEAHGNIEGNPELLYRPFINVYFGAAYIKWLSGYDGKQRSDEFVVRAYKGGIKKATHKSTMNYWLRYLSVKQSLPSREPQISENNSLVPDAHGSVVSASSKAGDTWIYWDSRVSQEDMDELWRHPDVLKEWTESGERRGKVRFSQDAEKRPYLSRGELTAISEIIVSRHFNTKGIRPTVLSALAELSSMRFVNGVGPCSGIMGIDYPTAFWLYKDVGYKAYKVNSVEDFYNPFLSMYFGAAYLAWLSEYKGRERTHEFIVQAYLRGPENVNLQETGPLWLKFQETLGYYEDPKKEHGNCSIL
ncbi:transglycosylase isoform X2 [Tasmannia lanceolata]|uniref:transglycosylase isoform X2 n=1 Tax=Tasmannia lanceolata TaxID=3420 RepID=UPI00406332E9